MRVKVTFKVMGGGSSKEKKNTSALELCISLLLWHLFPTSLSTWGIQRIEYTVQQLPVDKNSNMVQKYS